MAPPSDVITESGGVRGRRDGDVRTWRAIPYAAPPVGELRLRAPRPAVAWSGVRLATEFREAAVSHPFSAPLGVAKKQRQSEDCLTLNVSAPAERSSRPRPVMMFIHGGGYFEGSSGWPLYDPVHLTRRGDIVFVSINYRLNAFGYVDFSGYSTPERPFDSNLGLRDQVAALQWIQRNIAAFGGDPDNVTVFGESAGGCSVTTLLATPAAKGLFHRAVAQSAPADANLSPAQSAEVARRCLRRLGATEANAASVLTTANPVALKNAALRTGLATIANLPGRMPFGPVIDGDYLPEDPIRAFVAGRAHAVPLIIGTNRGELNLHGLIPKLLPTSVAAIDRMFAATIPDAKQAVLAGYPAYPKRSTTLQFGTDSFFRRPTLAVAQGHQAFAPTYLYRLDYAPPLLRKTGVGSFHGFDLFALFGRGHSPMTRILTVGGAEEFSAVADEMQAHWLNFARTGQPKPAWLPYTADRRSTLVIDRPSRIVDDLDGDIRLAWANYAGPHHDPSLAS